ncbi:unnamed protein product [Pleuronectes platessa]|uniref:Uncharacterized protein n=1 Tax=Pleuronectes platessa TaxID=8262 RepID=A0A9N7W1L3_PLEPL|nr:unnamed protein product [Pleuronectes platessa]
MVPLTRVSSCPERLLFLLLLLFFRRTALLFCQRRGRSSGPSGKWKKKKKKKKKKEKHQIPSATLGAQRVNFTHVFQQETRVRACGARARQTPRGGKVSLVNTRHAPEEKTHEGPEKRKNGNKNLEQLNICSRIIGLISVNNETKPVSVPSVGPGSETKSSASGAEDLLRVGLRKHMWDDLRPLISAGFICCVPPDLPLRPCSVLNQIRSTSYLIPTDPRSSCASVQSRVHRLVRGDEEETTGDLSSTYVLHSSKPAALQVHVFVLYVYGSSSSSRPLAHWEASRRVPAGSHMQNLRMDFSRPPGGGVLSLQPPASHHPAQVSSTETQPARIVRFQSVGRMRRLKHVNSRLALGEHGDVASFYQDLDSAVLLAPLCRRAAWWALIHLDPGGEWGGLGSRDEEGGLLCALALGALGALGSAAAGQLPLIDALEGPTGAEGPPSRTCLRILTTGGPLPWFRVTGPHMRD